jgi:hypothetical protein
VVLVYLVSLLPLPSHSDSSIRLIDAVDVSLKPYRKPIAFIRACWATVTSGFVPETRGRLRAIDYCSDPITIDKLEEQRCLT